MFKPSFTPVTILLFWAGAKDGNAPNARSKGEPMQFFKSTVVTTDVLKHNQACIVLN